MFTSINFHIHANPSPSQSVFSSSLCQYAWGTGHLSSKILFLLSIVSCTLHKLYQKQLASNYRKIPLCGVFLGSAIQYGRWMVASFLYTSIPYKGVVDASLLSNYICATKLALRRDRKQKYLLDMSSSPLRTSRILLLGRKGVPLVFPS